MHKHNFSAGPAILPGEVFAEAARAVTDFNGTGLSILEISHRSKPFMAVMDECSSLLRELLDLDNNWKVLYLQGGASSQFYMTAMNFLNDGDKAYYIDTGTWAKNAVTEARKIGTAEVLASSAADGYRYIPKGYSVPSDGRYLHITTNNTIYGTQYHAIPESPIPIVADMSSDIMSRPIDMSKFGMIYAGAQKNLGPAGVTLVLIREDFLGVARESLPTMLKYRTHIDKDSAFNTPPVFPIYVMMLNLRWLKAMGGLMAMKERNREKAQIAYAAIDGNPLFRGVVEVEDRSWMNATFVLEDTSLESSFLDMCKEAGIEGLKGHRSVGGFRASMYNALGPESVRVLADVMDTFTARNG